MIFSGWLNNRAVCLIGAVLASAVALHALTEPHALYGLSEYDDAVYLGSAFRLLHGHVPYRDFAFVQPPAITLLMTPFAAVSSNFDTRHAMVLARIATGCVVGINAFLAGWVVRFRGAFVALIASVLLAIYPTAYFADHTVLLEPYLILFCLIGMNLAFRSGRLASPRWLLFAGASFGVATSVKLWGVVPAVLLGFCVTKKPWLHIRNYAIGFVIGFAVICLPFIILAPHNFFHDIINAQVSRSTVDSLHLTKRLWSLFGFRGFSVHVPYETGLFALDVCAVVLGLIVIIGGAIPLLLQRSTRLEVFAAVAAVVTMVMLMTPTQFYPHYAYFFAGFAAVTIALCLSQIGRLLQNVLVKVTNASPSTVRRSSSAVLAVIAIISVLSLVVTVKDETHYARSALSHVPVNFTIIESSIPAGACVVSDAPALLIEANRFVSTDPNCPAIFDSDSTWLAYDSAQPKGTLGSGDTKLVAIWKSAFTHASYVVLSAPDSTRIPFTPALRVYFTKHYTRVVVSGALIYRNLDTAVVTSFQK